MLQTMRSAGKYVMVVVFIVFVGSFLFLENSGLMGGGGITPTTPVATVNGREILYANWANRVQSISQSRSEQTGRPLDLDELREVETRALDEMIAEVLLQEEYRRRGITVTDEEIREAAMYMPHPDLMQSPELQTDGRFDPEKYQRFLASPMARQGGLLQNLEAYYRSELPRQKLFEQVAAGVYVTDARMWQVWQDVHDSVQVTYVALAPALVPDAEVSVSDAELRTFFDNNRSMFERTGLAVVSVVEIPRAVTAADSAATLARVQALREEITSGQSTFEDVARRESMDQASSIEGGLLPPSPRGSFVPEFENAAYALAPGQVSQPVLSQFGYHLLRVDARAGDTLTIRHILIPVTQIEDSAAAAGRQADRLVSIAGGATAPERFDEAVSELNLAPVRATAIEGQPLAIGGQFIPSVSAWAFSGASVGETSELFEGEAGYYMARLDSIAPAGTPRFDDVREEVRAHVLDNRKLDQLEARAQTLANAAVAGTLEAAAAAQNLTPSTTDLFARISFVPGLGQGNKAIGAAFALPANAISAPVRTDDAIYVMRVDRRINADRSAWEAQRSTQRTLLTQSLQQERLQAFLRDLRESAKIVDRRDEINAAARASGAGL